MPRFANLNIGYKLSLAFCLIIGLGLAGYSNAVEAMRTYVRNSNRVQQVINDGISSAKDVAIASHDMASYTDAYVYSGDQSVFELTWVANESRKNAFADLQAHIGLLPHNTALAAAATQVAQQNLVCVALEDQAQHLTKAGHGRAAQGLYQTQIVPARDRLEITIDNALIAAMADYRQQSQRAELETAHHAILLGWTVQAFIALFSGLIGLLMSRHTGRTLDQLQHAQAQMRHSEQQLNNAQRIAHVGNWHTDLTNKTAIWSEELFQILGLRPGEVTPSQGAYLACVHPDDGALMQQSAHSAQGDLEPFSFYHRIVRGGDVRWLHVRGEFEADAAGKAVAMVGTAQDVTERKQAEEALHGSEERYRRLVESSPEVIAVHCEGKLVYVNAAGVSLFGASRPEELLGRRFLDMIHPDYHEIARQRIRRIEQQGLQTDLLHEKFVRLDGSLVDVEVVGIPTTHQGRSATQILVRDVTERRRAEEALVRSEEKFRALIRNASDTILILDEEGRMGYVSPGIQQTGGHDPVKVEGLSFFGFLHGDDLARARSVFSQARRFTGPTLTTELRLRHGDGTFHPVEVILQNLFHEPAVGGIVATCRDITERKAFEEELAYQAFHDALTGLPNRFLLMDRLERASARAGQRSGQIAVLYLDLDNFKVVNDSLGHTVGDDLLMTVAERLTGCVPATDTVARIGGDEFAVLLELAGGEESKAIAVAERIAALLARPIRLGEREMIVTTSLGIAFGAGGQSPAGLLRDADIAMYRAKGTGKAGYAVFHESMTGQAMERLELEGELRRAIECGELVLHYQPIVSLKTRAVCEVEALVRWEHPQRGLIPPAKFVPLAEETGLIVPLGCWVLGAACRQAQVWQARCLDGPPLVVGVNLSARQLQHPDLVADVARVLRETRLPPSALKLEITESVMMEDAEATTEKLHQLRALGVRLAVDDFGTGYSSMAYLSRFPIDTLKIDRAFVQKIGSADGFAILHAIVNLARALNLSVTSEGIETEEQWEYLSLLGCERGQGYLFSRPLSPRSLEPLLGPSAPAEQQLECAA